MCIRRAPCPATRWRWRLATLDIVLADGFYDKLCVLAQQLTAALTAVAQDAGVFFCAQAVGGMFGLYFSPQPPQNLTNAQQCDIAAFRKLFHAMLARGIYLAPAYEAGFITADHTADDLQKKRRTRSICRVRGHYPAAAF